MSWTRKHLLDIESLTADEIITVLDTAQAFKAVGERAIKKVPALRGKTVVDACCGSGMDAELLARRGAKLGCVATMSYS